MPIDNKHTPGPWRLSTSGRYIQSSGAVILGDILSTTGDCANAARIVACVNACEGIADVSKLVELREAVRALSNGVGPVDGLTAVCTALDAVFEEPT